MFIQFINEKNRFFVEHLAIIMTVCMISMSCGYVLQSDNLDWAVFIVQFLFVGYCIAWTILMWKMTQITCKDLEEEEEGKDAEN